MFSGKKGPAWPCLSNSTNGMNNFRASVYCVWAVAGGPRIVVVVVVFCRWSDSYCNRIIFICNMYINVWITETKSSRKYNNNRHHHNEQTHERKKKELKKMMLTQRCAIAQNQIHSVWFGVCAYAQTLVGRSAGRLNGNKVGKCVFIYLFVLVALFSSFWCKRKRKHLAPHKTGIKILRVKRNNSSNLRVVQRMATDAFYFFIFVPGEFFMKKKSLKRGMLFCSHTHACMHACTSNLCNAFLL